jgi:hypothetical protein
MSDRAVVWRSFVRRPRSRSLACSQTVGETRPGLAGEQPGDFECLLLRELDAPDAILTLVEG